MERNGFQGLGSVGPLMKVAASIGTGSAEEAAGAGAGAQVKNVESGMIDASAALPYASNAPRATRAGAPDVVPVPINEQAGGGALASPVELLERAAETIELHAARAETVKELREEWWASAAISHAKPFAAVAHRQPSAGGGSGSGGGGSGGGLVGDERTSGTTSHYEAPGATSSASSSSQAAVAAAASAPVGAAGHTTSHQYDQQQYHPQQQQYHLQQQHYQQQQYYLQQQHYQQRQPGALAHHHPPPTWTASAADADVGLSFGGYRLENDLCCAVWSVAKDRLDLLQPIFYSHDAGRKGYLRPGELRAMVGCVCVCVYAHD